MDLSNYINKLKERASSKNTAQTYIASIALPYLPGINWQNETLEADMKLFWISVYRFNKCHTIYEFQKLLDWTKGKNLHPKQVIKTLINKPKWVK